MPELGSQKHTRHQHNYSLKGKSTLNVAGVFRLWNWILELGRTQKYKTEHFHPKTHKKESL